jgi:outer membrane protein assembly factor BamA
VVVQFSKPIRYLTFLLLFFANYLQAQQYKLELVCKDKGNAALLEQVTLLDNFSGREACETYLRNSLLPALRQKGFLEASVDSLVEMEKFSKAWLHLGEQYKWGSLLFDSSFSLLDADQLDKIKYKKGELLQVASLIEIQEAYLSLLEDNGYPFASVKMDSSYFIDNQLYASLRAIKGPLYSIDSIHVEGKIKINKKFLVQYLGLGDGSIYRKKTLELVSKRIADLGFVRETKNWDLSLTGTGAILNLYLEPAQSSRFNLLAGFMPSNQQVGGKLLLTGEAEMDLKNTFGGGENVYLNWQQIQVKSPRLQLGFTKPYVLNSNAGIDFNFNLLRKDSTFLTLNTRVGLRYEIKPRQVAKIFFQQYTSSLLDVDTNRIKQTKSLPSYLDATTSNLGVDFTYSATDYFFNPLKGMEFEFRLLGGIRKIRKNNAITQLKQTGANAFDYAQLYDTVSLSSSQFRITTRFNNYLKLGKQSTLKTGIQSGWLLGKQLLVNELFQIGGIKTLRGFDEESLFSSGYAVGTLEYRYLLARASYLFGFLDAAYVERKAISGNLTNFYSGFGLGISLETKSGVFSLAYAIGKKPSDPIQLREAKIHFGFVTLF